MSGSTLIRALVLIALMVAVVADLATFASHSALAEDAPPVLVSAEACKVDSEPSHSDDVASSTNEEIWDYAEGVPADSLLVQILVNDRLTRFLGCVNAGDVAAASKLVTDSYARSNAFPEDESGTVAPLDEGEELTYTAVDAVRVHESGEVVVFLTLQDPTYCSSDISVAVVYRQVDGTWLIDDTAQIVDFAPVPWQPPGVRDADSQGCDDVASIDGIQSLQQPVSQDGETKRRTAKSIIDSLWENDGNIRLTDTEVEGFLDLRGVPSNKIVASNVRFLGGIDVSIPFDNRGLEFVDRPMMDFYFREVEFGGDVNLELDQFEKFECHQCTFKGILDLSYADIGNVYVKGSRFESDVRFNYTDVGIVLDIADSHFYGSADFTGVQSPLMLLSHVSSAEPLQITWEALGDGWIERRIDETLSAGVDDKQSLFDEIDSDLHFLEKNFSALGQQRDADAVHAERLRLRHDYYHDWTDPEKWQLTSIGFLTGWGADPWRPLKLIGVIVVLFGFVYWRMSPFEPADPSKQPIGKEPGWLFSMLYSIDVFVPFTIATGVKEWGWVIRGPMRWVAVFERFVGAVVSAAYAFNIGAYLL